MSLHSIAAQITTTMSPDEKKVANYTVDRDKKAHDIFWCPVDGLKPH